ncbi:hypothetical protein ACFWPU_07675 [Streptomyces sp. NPDC058471]|uniref:hypothetical protein n=1 Tax=Streptomyces sp. NPDC058471 TaxID=3346516 RepID=UPI003651E8B1
MPVLHGLVAIRPTPRRLLCATDQWHNTPLSAHAVEWFAVAGAAVLLHRIDETLGRLTP